MTHDPRSFRSPPVPVDLEVDPRVDPRVDHELDPLVDHELEHELEHSVDASAEQDNEQDTVSMDEVLRTMRARRAPRPKAPEPKADRADDRALDRPPVPSRTAREASRAQVLPFRRSPTARRVRRLRRHPLVRWLQPLAIALALVGTPTAVVAWMLQAPEFAVDEIRLSTDSPDQRVSSQWVRDRLEPLRGHNLWRLDLGVAADEVANHSWVADVGIRKQPPSTLVVRVLERREAALYRDPAGLWYVDTEGRPVAPVGPDADAEGLPILSVPRPIQSAGGRAFSPAAGETTPELRAAVELLREMRGADIDWAAGVRAVEILSTEDFKVHTTDLPFPLLVRAGTVEQRSRRLAEMLPWIRELGDLDGVDLRFARRIIVEPADPEAQSAEVGDLEAT